MRHQCHLHLLSVAIICRPASLVGLIVCRWFCYGIGVSAKSPSSTQTERYWNWNMELSSICVHCSKNINARIMVQISVFCATTLICIWNVSVALRMKHRTTTQRFKSKLLTSSGEMTEEESSLLLKHRVVVLSLYAVTMGKVWIFYILVMFRLLHVVHFSVLSKYAVFSCEPNNEMSTEVSIKAVCSLSW